MNIILLLSPRNTARRGGDGRFWKEKRIVLPLEEMPKNLINAFLAAEDGQFYKHKGK
jgi:membrane carboxypeptidase/penicillin-binding protein